MSIESERFNNIGEPLVYFNKLTSLPTDAGIILHIRSEVAKELEEQGGRRTPIDDLIIETGRDDLKVASSLVTHPITFILPTPVLKLLSRFPRNRISL